MGIAEVTKAPRSPWQNAYVEERSVALDLALAHRMVGPAPSVRHVVVREPGTELRLLDALAASCNFFSACRQGR
jgi:hypothetical protein